MTSPVILTNVSNVCDHYSSVSSSASTTSTVYRQTGEVNLSRRLRRIQRKLLLEYANHHGGSNRSLVHANEPEHPTQIIIPTPTPQDMDLPLFPSSMDP